jgi:lipid-A-disaccharide synthase
MLEAARRLEQRRAGVQKLVTRAPGLPREWFEERVACGNLRDVRIHGDDFPEILSVCATGAVASGTACLEAAITGLPMAVVYRMGVVSAAIGRALVRLPHVAMPNLVAGRRVVPELIQGECTPDRIAAELLRFLERPDEASRVRGELAALRDRLGGPGVFERAAEAVLAEISPGDRG